MYFDRKPDNDGFNYWMDKLNAGDSRETVFAGFANSLEFYNLCNKYGVTQGVYLEGVDNTQQGGINCFVARLYKVCFNRLPDMGGQSDWVNKLYRGEITGTSCSYGFIFSPEFTGKNPTNEEFVNYMYKAFFGREANNSVYGDSRITGPYSHLIKDIVKIKGGNNCYFVIGTINLQEIYEQHIRNKELEDLIEYKLNGKVKNKELASKIKEIKDCQVKTLVGNINKRIEKRQNNKIK